MDIERADTLFWKKFDQIARLEVDIVPTLSDGSRLRAKKITIETSEFD